MARTIVKLNGYYLEFSSVVDAPVTFGMSLADFKLYYQEAYGSDGMRELDAQLERVEAKGTSSFIDASAADAMSFNRAGPNESCLTLDEIYQAYCLRVPIRCGWLVPIAT